MHTLKSEQLSEDSAGGAPRPGNPLRGAAAKVPLSTADVTWAAQNSQPSLPDPLGEAQWQQFLSALAYKGVERWLQIYRVPQQLTLWRSTAETGAVCQIGNQSVGLVVQSSLSEGWVSLPSVPPGLGTAAPQVFILVEVREEMNQVVILAGLHRCLLLEPTAIASAADSLRLGTQVPVSAFDWSSSQILQHLLGTEPLEEPELVQWSWT